MSAILTEAVPAALGAAVLYNVAPIIEAVAGRRQPDGAGIGLGLLARLVRDPMWLGGMACDLAGFALEIVALALAPLLLVQPMEASGLVLLVVGGAVFLGERLTSRGIVGMVGLLAGVVLLTLSAGSLPNHPVIPGALRMCLAAAAAVVPGTAFFIAGNRALRRGARGACGGFFGAASGVSYTISAVATRYLAVELHHFDTTTVLRALQSPAPYLLAVTSIVATGLLQRGLQVGAALSAIPTMTSIVAVLPIPAGVVLFHERLASGTHLHVAGFGLSLAFTVAGVLLVSSQRGLASALGHQPS